MDRFIAIFIILLTISFPFLVLAMFYLCWRLLFFKIKYNKTNNKDWLNLYQFWIKIFIFCLFYCCFFCCSILVFYMPKPHSWELFIFAVFAVLASLGIMLFGINKVPDKLHTLATFLVTIGTFYISLYFFYSTGSSQICFHLLYHFH